ncbi:MAG TPA: MoaD/ThiS family protein [Candidatus Kapabacteria bacterium]|nr:MoaD/ThiS family protein [Candidatus Kapabacteria bacterium]
MKVYLSTHLRGYAHERSQIEANGATLAEALADMERQFPGIRQHIINEQDEIRQHMKIFINQDQEKNLNSSLKPGDAIHIIGALSGG